MRILSDFHDYYDCVMGHGQATDLLYQRKIRVLDPAPSPFPKFESRFAWDTQSDFQATEYIIGFCGKIYACVLVSVYNTWKGIENAYCWSIEDVDKFVEKFFKKKEIADYYDAKKKWHHRSNWPYARRRVVIEKFFADVNQQEDSHQELFMELNAPIFVCRRADYPHRRKWQITTNPRLKDFEFVRVMDPYTAFQELQMFFGNMAEPRKHIPEISDEDMLSIKGFDKWSFKRHPGERKRRKKGKK